jgi:hypothetical protein
VTSSQVKEKLRQEQNLHSFSHLAAIVSHGGSEDDETRTQRTDELNGKRVIFFMSFVTAVPLSKILRRIEPLLSSDSVNSGHS